jgi:penicillin-binding protein 2
MANGSRRNFILITLGFAFLVITIKLFHLQILQGKRYFRLSEANHIRKVYTPATRGKIYDCNGILLADTRPSFALSIIPCEIDSQTIGRLSEIVSLDEERLHSLIYNQAYIRTPVKIKHHLDIKTTAKIEENLDKLPGVVIEIEPRRIYPYGEVTAHVIGYLGEITQDELKADSFYKPWHYVGRYGIEAIYESCLRGKDGIRYTEIDALGRELGPIPEKREVLPEPGLDIELTIDAELQELAYSLISKYQRGAIVGINLTDGGIICLVSYPSFDPQLLTQGISAKDWEQLVTDKSCPLINRVISTAYAPGSTIKPLWALLALENNLIEPNTRFAPCTGIFRYGNRQYRCLGKHGSLTLVDAIAFSCNTYFYQLALKLGIDRLSNFLAFYEVDQKTGIDLPNERRGTIPNRNYLDRRYGKGRWTSGLLVNFGVGQGEILITPLRLALIYSAIANNGEYFQPYLVKTIRNSSSIIFRHQPQKKSFSLSRESLKIIKEALKEVVTRGTGWGAYLEEMPIAGKTGTAENPPYRDNAWFVGYAPADNPEVLFCVLVENIGKGGAIAAPMARELIERYFRKKKL